MKVSAPPEDPAEQAAADAETQRADSAAISDTQDVLGEEDRKRLRELGAPGLTGGSSTGSGFSPSFAGYGATLPMMGGFGGGSPTGGGAGASRGTAKA